MGRRTVALAATRGAELGVRRALVGVLVVAAACSARGDSASVSITSPDDGRRVAGTATIEMAAEGLTIEAAGEARDGAGHFHVIIDDGCVEEGEAVPKDVDHVHFGKGQSSGPLYLSPGDHELCLQAADGVHIARSETDTIDVKVAIESIDEWCRTVEEVDDLFLATDTGDLAFADRQIGYQNIARLVDQLLDAEDLVPDADRQAVIAGVTLAGEFASAIGAAADEQAAGEVFEAVLGDAEETFNAAEPWIKEACGVDIND
jgi:hypothetical protein